MMKIVFMIPSRIGEFGHKVPKGAESYYTIKEALRRGYINKIVCCGTGAEAEIEGKIVKNPLLHWRVTWAIDKSNQYLKLYDGTPGWVLFDLAGQRFIKDSDIFHGFPFVPHCFQRAKQRNITTIMQMTAAYPGSMFSSFRTGLIRDCLRYTDYIFALSDPAKETYIKEGFPEDRMVNISFGVDEKKFKPGEKRDAVFRGLFVGSMYPYKGIKYLLKAWSRLNLKNSELVLCGIIPDETKGLIDSYRTRIAIKTPGHVDPVPYYQEASVYIHPSLTEGFEKVTLEAMSSGLPVVVSNHTGASTIIQDGKEGFVIPIKDVESIKARIQYFYDNPDEIGRMGRNARRLIESNYTWDCYSKRVADAYERVYEMEKG